MEQTPAIYGLMAEFREPEALVAAARKAHAAGYRKMDGYTSFPVHGLADALGQRRSRLPRLVFLGGLAGFLLAFGMQYYSAVIHYPLNIGGRPLNSWPVFVPVIFELTVLLASFTAVFGMIGLNGLPQPYHPVFNVPNFQLASTDSFFLCIESTDPKFDAQQTREFMSSLGAHEIAEVPF